MKIKSIAVCVIATIITACSIPNASVPVGYRTCANDSACKRGEYCGFKGVNQYAVCLSDPNRHAIKWQSQ